VIHGSGRLPIALLALLHTSPVGAAPPGAAQTTTVPPEELATSLVAASDSEWSAMLERDDVATVEVAKALLAIGDEARLEAEWLKAALAFQIAEAVARRANSPAEVGRALNGHADSLFRVAQIDRAMVIAEESRHYHEEREDIGGLADVWNIFGNIYLYQPDYPQAAAAYEKSRELSARVGNRFGVARALGNAGNINKLVGNLDEAIAQLEESLSIFEELGDRRIAALVTNNIGSVHGFRGDLPQALEWSRRGLAIHEELGDRSGIAKDLDTLGNIYRAQGAYGRALQAFHRSLELRETLGDPYAVAESENNMGLVHFSQGDYQLAIDAYKRSIRTVSRAGIHGLIPEALTNIGAAAWRLGQTERARANFRESLAISQREQQKLLVAENLQALGRVALAIGNAREADEMLQQALRVREELQDQLGITEALNGLATLKLATGQYREALDLARRSTDVARRYEQYELLWEAQTLTGMAHRGLGDIEAARSAFEEAVGSVERLRQEVVGRSLGGRERFFESKLSPYQELVALALARNAPKDALEIAERAKARALSDMFSSPGAGGTRVMTPEERGDEHRLRMALGELNRRLLAERTKPSPDELRIRALEGERQSARSDYEAFRIALDARHPELRAQRGEVTPFEFTQTASLLPDESVALVEYVVASDATHLFVLSQSDGKVQLDSYELKIGQDRLAANVRRLRDRLAARDLLFDEDARANYDLFLGPATPALAGKRHVVIVPGGPLWEMPFQALRDPRGRYLIESMAVSFAPSLTVLRESFRARRPRNGLPTLLAMGKGDFGSKDARPALLMSELLPLPEAERQVQLLPELYGVERSAVYVGPDATEARFKAEAPHHRIIHVATHGLLEETSPLYSSVVLSTTAGESGEDGLVEAWEMLDLKLDADLVILSACETARGRVASGEGIVGTMWALLAAGAQATIVSQWKVATSSTTDLMTALHRRLAPAELGKADALRQATLDVLKNPRYAHPFYWAPFVLVGNPF
jgi:CHAT domain-containing protein/tetratricopeptide (TPR) repeat protein